MDYQCQQEPRPVHATTVKVQTQGNLMKDFKNKNLKLKAQKPQTASSNNHSGSMKASKKSYKERKKKFLKEKWDKKKE